MFRTITPPRIRDYLAQQPAADNLPIFTKYRPLIWQPGFVESVGTIKAGYLIPEIYYRTAHPTRHHTIDEWVGLLGKVGKVAGTPDARRMWVFRGAARNNPHGLSWTVYHDLADEHARRIRGGVVFATRVSVPEILDLRTTPVDEMKPVEFLVDSRPHELTEVR